MPAFLNLGDETSSQVGDNSVVHDSEGDNGSEEHQVCMG